MSMCHSRHVGNCLPKENLKMDELYDYEILDLAMENTYNLIIGDTTIKQFLDTGQDFMPFIGDPYNPSREDIESLLRHYEDKEEYEKCIKIKEYDFFDQNNNE